MITAVGRAFAALVVGACLGFVIGICVIFLVPSRWLPEDESGLLTLATFGGPPLLAVGTGFAAWVLMRERRGYSTKTPIMVAATGLVLLMGAIGLIGRLVDA